MIFPLKDSICDTILFINNFWKILIYLIGFGRDISLWINDVSEVMSQGSFLDFNIQKSNIPVKTNEEKWTVSKDIDILPIYIEYWE